ncbi:WD40 repeat-like protein [Cystobasidium minutum MCA 4210]|uniref:WD40 repeat-like protein n=1 Tax=Cystobasidium minutum MCA 4210 TaxID=1397322 RepID=UPI0034CFE8AA|eukprot:jgi/Rhomi1/143397/e_gw1.3.901.1
MDEDSNAQQIVVSSGGKGSGQLVASIQRTSGLQAPIVSFAGGHDAEILDIKFNASGDVLASAGVDKRINLWRVYGSDEDNNFAVLKAQNGAITSLAFPATGNHLTASSTDKTVATFDIVRGDVVKRHRGHKGIVNDVDVTRGGNRELIASASDDGTIKIWDLDTKEAIDQVELEYPVTAVKWSQDGQQLFIGGIDNDIHAYDLRSKSVLYTLFGHNDTITSLSLSPSGTHILSASADDTIRVWDVRPFAPSSSSSGDPNADPRLYKTFPGAPAGFEGWLRKASWDRDGSRVAVGGADRTVTIYNVEQSRLTHKLPGHTGFVTAAAFSPKDNIIASCGIDRAIYLGEIPER